MVTVRSDNTDYIKWIYRNPAAFMLNLNSKGTVQSMIHTARCMHLYEPDPAYDHVSGSPKVSSDSLDELLLWAKDDGRLVVECTTCLPFDRTG